MAGEEQEARIHPGHISWHAPLTITVTMPRIFQQEDLVNNLVMAGLHRA
jgi:hypothetical protein